MTVIDRISACLAQGEAVTLERIGGVDGLEAEREAVLQAPFLDILVAMTVTAPESDQPMLDALLIDGFAAASSPTVLRDAAHLLIEAPHLRDRLARALAPILFARVADRSDPRTDLLAAYALEALFRMALADAMNRHRLLALLTEIEGTPSELFAAHVAKLLGAAYTQWGGDDLIVAIERLLPAAGAEAAFELGLIMLGNALEQASMPDILAGLEAAQLRFRQATLADEDRVDAAAFDAIIDMIRGFWDETGAADLQAALSRLERAIADRRALLQTGSLPPWLAPRADREIAWVGLARSARRAVDDLSRPSWLNAAATLNAVLVVYDAERTLKAGPGLSLLVRPRIEAAFVRERGLVEHLNQLLLEPDVFGIDAGLAAQLRDSVQRRSEELTASRKVEENVSYPLLTSVLHGLPGADQLPQPAAAALESALGQKAGQAERFANPVINQLFRELTAAVASCTDYRGETKDGFDALLAQILMFCADRQDAGRKQLGSRTEYLRADDAKEGDLQSDLRQFVKGNLTTAEVLTEVEGIATGRSDLYVGFGGLRFIAELKRHFGAVDRDVAKTYFGQAGAYQATNVRLGFLGILELVDRAGPPPTIAECLWHVNYIPEGSTLARHIIVFCVPGKLKTPSSL
ncbi:hypothetical protein [Sphingobium sp. WCS2017Hpa-17]|uniref:hypothetical protein n=1 Tax=Sphingobium sp. WCS2017Hpa-17 TaxID=3073638 RepID=UPI002889DCA8|nr:hypothetical protein [Sphingobium sp. WCS2017Hpa-17]